GMVLRGAGPRPGEKLVVQRRRVLLRFFARGRSVSQRRQSTDGRDGGFVRVDAQSAEETRVRGEETGGGYGVHGEIAAEGGGGAGTGDGCGKRAVHEDARAENAGRAGADATGIQLLQL